MIPVQLCGSDLDFGNPDDVLGSEGLELNVLSATALSLSRAGKPFGDSHSSRYIL